VVPHFFNSGLPRAIRTTKKRLLGFYSVSDDLAAAVIADGREFVDRTLEAIEGMTRAGGDDLEREIIVVTAHFTFCHHSLPFLPILLPGCNIRAATSPSSAFISDQLCLESQQKQLFDESNRYSPSGSIETTNWHGTCVCVRR